MPAFPTLSFSHLGIFVFDLKRMKRFYTEMLGFVVSDLSVVYDSQKIAFLRRRLITWCRFRSIFGIPRSIASRSSAIRRGTQISGASNRSISISPTIRSSPTRNPVIAATRVSGRSTSGVVNSRTSCDERIENGINSGDRLYNWLVQHD